MKITSPSSSSKVSKIDQEQYLYLTTRGRNSGRPREIEIWFTQHDGRFFVIAEYETSHWIQNLRAYPEVQVRLGGQSFPAQARILNSIVDASLRRAIQDLSRAKYGWGDGTVVELKRCEKLFPPRHQTTELLP
ncbi:MAG: nitroreductase/quinone reductase family protein [Terriglobales bacterium]